MAPSPSTPPSPGPRLPLDRVLLGIHSVTRWQILRQLLKQPLPVCELAARLRYTESAMSKQMVVLHGTGIVRRRFGLYSIEPRYLVPGENSIDLGHVLLRLD